jgi:predicted O-methyltransferase YrrM
MGFGPTPSYGSLALAYCLEEIRLPEVSGITNIAFPMVDLSTTLNPIPAILAAPEFATTKTYFAKSPSATRSLLSITSQVLLFSIIRNLRPDHVIEIGTYRAGTSEVLTRAAQANNHGTVHTISPFDADRVNAIMPYWPAALRQHVQYHPMDSMAFFMKADNETIHPGLVLVDGNHDYEFASFDIQAAAKRMRSGGFLFIDNVSQAGPYFATKDFIRANPDWIDCAVKKSLSDDSEPFSYGRSTVPDTDFFILRAPAFYVVGNRPLTFGEITWPNRAVRGIKLSFARTPRRGMLHMQCILRAFHEARSPIEVVGAASVQLDGACEVEVPLQNPLVTDGHFDAFRVEAWLAWTEAQPLALRTPPIVY